MYRTADPNKLRAWAGVHVGKDGKRYSVRYLLAETEMDALAAVGAIGDVSEIVGMQAAADECVARIERDLMLNDGGQLQ